MATDKVAQIELKTERVRYLRAWVGIPETEPNVLQVCIAVEEQVPEWREIQVQLQPMEKINETLRFVFVELAKAMKP